MSSEKKSKTNEEKLTVLEILDILEKEKDISKEVMLEAIENSLVLAYKKNYNNDKADNVKVTIDRETGDFAVYAVKTIVETVTDKTFEISEEEAKVRDPHLELGDTIDIELKPKDFGRIAAQNAKNTILQKIREEERRMIYDQFHGKQGDIITGVVQRVNGRRITVNLGKADAILSEAEQVRGEYFQQGDRIKLYVVEVRDTSKGPKIIVSRTHPELVKRLFEAEVAEIKDGTVEIMAIAREAGSRTKMAVYSHDPNVDPIGACVGVNGSRVGAVVSELRGEKIDIINWSDNAAQLIENALSPAKVISVMADNEEKVAEVVVPDYQLSLAIGKEGQNARLAAHLTGFGIDIKSESQVDYLYDEYDEYDDEYVENGDDSEYEDTEE